MQEIQRIGEYFGRRAASDTDEGRSLILLGDFNIVSREHGMMEGLTKAGFSAPEGAREGAADEREKEDVLRPDRLPNRRGGPRLPRGRRRGRQQRPRQRCLIFENVYTDAQRGDYRAQMERAPSSDNKSALDNPAGYFRKWRTRQFSDHFPLWVRLKVNGASEYLEQVD